jgi:hypothetical protein
LLPVFSNLPDNADWKAYNSQRTHFNGRVNEFLQAVAKYYNWKNKPTCTTLRHTIITNACAKGLGTHLVASIAHTSERQLKRTYVNMSAYLREATKGIAI